MCERLPGQCVAISVSWRDKQIEHTRLITQLDPHHANGSKNYLPFWEIFKLSLDSTLNRFKVDGMGDVAEDVMRHYARLCPSPENLAVLERLKKQD